MRRFVNYHFIDEVEEFGVVAVFEGLSYHIFERDFGGVVHFFSPFLTKAKMYVKINQFLHL